MVAVVCCAACCGLLAASISCAVLCILVWFRRGGNVTELPLVLGNPRSLKSPSDFSSKTSNNRYNNTHKKPNNLELRDPGRRWWPCTGDRLKKAQIARTCMRLHLAPTRWSIAMAMVQATIWRQAFQTSPSHILQSQWTQTSLAKSRHMSSPKAEALLNATGRVARTTGLDLSAAGIRGNNDGLEVNALFLGPVCKCFPRTAARVSSSASAYSTVGMVFNDINVCKAVAAFSCTAAALNKLRLQTSNPDVFAAGDCLPDGSRFTHAAEWQARVAVRNAMLGEELDARRCGRATIARRVMYQCTSYNHCCKDAIADNNAAYWKHSMLTG